jgi:hypothetical protein
MCGIVGFVTKKKAVSLPFKYRDIFKQMLFVDQLRGDDSTGVYSVNDIGNVAWLKESSSVDTFLTNKDVDKWVDTIGLSSKVVVGHNRSATKGQVMDKNAHPFIEGNTILVHNGTIFNQKELNQDVDVDSHAICHAIEAFGIEDTLHKIKGAYALAIYKVKDKTLTLTRNQERPLWLGESEDAWFFASEPWMAYGVAARHNVEIKGMKLLNVSTLYAFDISQEITKLSETVIEKPIVVQEKVKSSFTKRTPPALKEGTPVAKLVGYFNRGDVICFKPDVARKVGNVNRLEGHHYVHTNVEVIVHGVMKKTIEELVALTEIDLLTSEVSSVFYDSNTNKLTLFVDGAEISDITYSENFTELNEELLSKVSHCSCCHRQIGEIEETYVSLKENGKMYVLCDECLTSRRSKNPLWGAS